MERRLAHRPVRRRRLVLRYVLLQLERPNRVHRGALLRHGIQRRHSRRQGSPSRARSSREKHGHPHPLLQGGLVASDRVCLRPRMVAEMLRGAEPHLGQLVHLRASLVSFLDAPPPENLSVALLVAEQPPVPAARGTGARRHLPALPDRAGRNGGEHHVAHRLHPGHAQDHERHHEHHLQRLDQRRPPLCHDLPHGLRIVPAARRRPVRPLLRLRLGHRSFLHDPVRQVLQVLPDLALRVLLRRSRRRAVPASQLASHRQRRVGRPVRPRRVRLELGVADPAGHLAQRRDADAVQGAYQPRRVRGRCLERLRESVAPNVHPP
mmetsp:Transcript_7807/g.23890  ORF Transcript_7807/g.23890 Transcript_7807/m.23890 type:complete len:322 (+) Transcript_7807:1674-2639(+)